jgi:hypothetical protein
MGFPAWARGVDDDESMRNQVVCQWKKRDERIGKVRQGRNEGLDLLGGLLELGRMSICWRVVWWGDDHSWACSVTRSEEFEAIG